MIKRDLNSYFVGELDESTLWRLKSVINRLRNTKEVYEEMRRNGYKWRDKETHEVIDWEYILDGINHQINKAEQEYKEISIRLKKSQINKEFEEGVTNEN